jgi:hypothetical protein
MIRIFKYLPGVDSFVVTDEYRVIAETLGLVEWNPVVWIGRLFILDNDYGEHWFDNWDLRDARGLNEEHFIIDPARFQNGKDGPCHSPAIRKQFWTDVLKSLELSLDLLCDVARQMNDQKRELHTGCPGAQESGFEPIEDLEERIASLRKRYNSKL